MFEVGKGGFCELFRTEDFGVVVASSKGGRKEGWMDEYSEHRTNLNRIIKQ